MVPGAECEAAVAVEPKVEPGLEAAAAQPPPEAGSQEQARQDEAMSVTTVPDEAVKQEAGDAAAAASSGGDSLQASYLGGSQHIPQLPAVARGEVIITPAEAKQQKLQKGYSLEPVLVDPAAAVAPPVIVSGKRERKKSNHFGHSPDNEPEAPARPKAGRVHNSGRPSHGGGGTIRQHHAQSPFPVTVPDTAPASAPWITDRKKHLQERLARLTRQLKRFTGPSAAGTKGGYAPAPAISPVPGSPCLWYHQSHAETPAPFHVYGQAPASRSMSVDGAADHTPAFGGGNGRVRDRKRAREGSEIPAVTLPGGGKKPKLKKGQERLAPTGKLRNLYLHSEKLIEGLMKEKMAIAYFNVPVDPDALGIPHYRDIIKSPMDLGTIKGKLEGGYYSGIETLESDIYLVFDNAMHFNPPGTDVHECAKALKDISEKRIKRLPKAPTSTSKGGMTSAFANSSDSPGVGTPTSFAASGGTAADQRKMADMLRKMEQMQRDLELVKSKGSSSAKKPAEASGKKKSSNNNSNRVMTFEDKRTLSMNINKLPHEKLGKVVEIIKKRRSNVVGNSEEIEIDIDLLDNTTLKELDKYVKDCLHPKPKTPAVSKNAALQSAVQEVVGSVASGAGMGGIKGSDSDSDSSESDGD